MRPRTSGFTAIELMITLTVLTLLAAIAIPQWQQTVLKSRLLTATHAIYHAFSQARQVAALRNTPVTLCTGDAQQGCQTGQNVAWQMGFIAFTDPDRDGVLDTDEQIVFTHTPATGLTILGNSPMNKPIIFQPLGFAEQPGGAFSAGRVRICAPKNFDGHAQDVVLLKSGMVRMESASFGGTCPAP
ncbi:GspH/FimT family pseudopilin [Halothiobacillus sp. DCM-1]|uniref:GspH/FimT family pseudopilin n=1 Tax=Halothiobacillus sp. DCM-1 TaxID=3112558 RepID=UPI00324B8372